MLSVKRKKTQIAARISENNYMKAKAVCKIVQGDEYKYTLNDLYSDAVDQFCESAEKYLEERFGMPFDKLKQTVNEL